MSRVAWSRAPLRLVALALALCAALALALAPAARAQGDYAPDELDEAEAPVEAAVETPPPPTDDQDSIPEATLDPPPPPSGAGVAEAGDEVQEELEPIAGVDDSTECAPGSLGDGCGEGAIGRRGKTHIRKGGKARNGVWWHTDTADVKNGRKATPVMTQEESEPDYINLKEPEYVPDPIDNQQPTIPYEGEM